MKKFTFLLLLFCTFYTNAQVGVNTTDPKAQLDIRSTNQATPSNTDGMLIPKINAFPVTNPTVDQQGMLVYLTTTVGAFTPGFYYWNNPTTAWLPVKGTDGGTLDQAYDFGGVGNGRTITADTGAVTIAGTDGLVSTGTSGSGALAPTGAGTRMVWNPRKAAFRAGNVSGTQWDDANVGANSVAFGNVTTASGPNSMAFGSGSTASNNVSTAFGNGTTASGPNSTAFGFATTASGASSTTFGTLTAATALNSSAFGRNNTASSYGETVIGIGATIYTPSTNGTTQFRTTNSTDRLFVIGNAIDANNNDIVDTTERSDAMVVLKNGNVGVGISTPQNKLHFHNPTGFETFMQLTNSVTGSAATDGVVLGNTVAGGEAGIVNQENSNFYLFSGLAGEGQLTIGGNGNVGIGTFDISSPPQEKFHVLGNIRIEDGNQAAGKVLTSDANGTGTWQNASANAWSLTGNSGTNSVTNFIGTTDDTDLIFRRNNIQAGRLGISNSSYGVNALLSNTTGFRNTANGVDALVANTNGNLNTANGFSSLSLNTIGIGNTANGTHSLHLNTSGSSNAANGASALFNNTTGSINTANGVAALQTNVTGNQNSALGFFADVATDNLTNATAIGARSLVAASNSLVLGSVNGVNGATTTVNVGIGTTTPLERLHVAGRAFFTDGFSADNAALLYRNDTDYMFLGPQSGSSADGGALALFGSTNVSGGNAGGIDLNVPNAQVRMSHTNGSYAFRANSTSGYAATFELNDTGLEIGHNSAGRALIFSPNSAERMRITPTGNVGIGTTPARKFHVSNGSSGGTSNANTGFVLESSTNVYQHFLTPNANESGLLFGSNSASIHGGIIFDNSDQDITFRTGGNVNRAIITSAGDVGIGVTIPGGQLELSLDEGRKPGTGTWTLSSDKRLKTINGKYTKGLNEILQLNPILFNYKNNGEHKFEQKVLDTEFPGFIAQEVQPLFPDAVGTDADGFLNFNIHPILIASINAFKELDIKNKELKQENETLKEKLNLQEEQLKSILVRLSALERK